MLDREPGLRIDNMRDAAIDGAFKGIYIRGEGILQSDPDTRYVSAGLEAMEWQRAYRDFSRRSRRIAPLEAAE